MIITPYVSFKFFPSQPLTTTKSKTREQGKKKRGGKKSPPDQTKPHRVEQAFQWDMTPCQAQQHKDNRQFHWWAATHRGPQSPLSWGLASCRSNCSNNHLGSILGCQADIPICRAWDLHSQGLKAPLSSLVNPSLLPQHLLVSSFSGRWTCSCNAQKRCKHEF